MYTKLNSQIRKALCGIMLIVILPVAFGADSVPVARAQEARIETLTEAPNGTPTSPLTPDLAPMAIVTKLPGPPGVSPSIDVVIDPDNDQNIFLANTEFVFYSHNGGLSWNETLITPAWTSSTKDIEICLSNPSTLYITGVGYLGRSTDAGENWRKIEQEWMRTWQPRIACDPTNELSVYFLDYWGGLYRSDDGGNNWVTINNGLNGSHLYSILIDQEESNKIFIGTNSGLYQSNDRGDSWKLLMTEIGTTVSSLAGFFDGSSSIIYAETEQGIFKSLDGGNSWSYIHDVSYGVYFGTDTVTVDPSNKNIVYLNLWNEGIYKSINGGNTWQTKNAGLTNYYWSTRLIISRQHPDILIYTAYGAGSVSKSIDGGNNWFDISNSLSYQRVDTVTIGKYLYASAGAAGIYYSKDYGQTWQLGKGMQTADEIQGITIDPVDNRITYSVSFNGQVWKSVDAGENWQLILKTDKYTRDIAISPSDPETLFVAATDEGVYRSRDGGETWVRLTNGIEGKFIAVVAVDPNDKNIILCMAASNPTIGAVIDNTYRIYRSIDEGYTWNQVYQVETEQQYPNMADLAFEPIHPGTVYAVFYGSPGVVSSDNGQTWTTENDFNEGGDDLLVMPLDFSHIWIARIVDGKRVIINVLGEELIINDDRFRWIIYITNDQNNSGILYVADGVRGVYKVDVRDFLTSVSTFSDVPNTHWASTFIKRLFANGITDGCSTTPLMYCPENPVTRAQMSVFLERSINSFAFTPPPGTGTVFADVPFNYWAASWIERLYADHITSGCGTSPLIYCPERSVTRAEMAVFLLRAKYGTSYDPPEAVGIFTDVPTSYWAANWIERLYAEGITTGCGTSPLTYCPENPVTRAQMAVFLVRTFNLP